MERPGQQLINEAGTEVERYIAKLEKSLAVAEQQLSDTRKILGTGEACRVPENVQMLVAKYLELQGSQSNVINEYSVEQHAAKKREQLDQFAMAALSVAHAQVQELRPETIREITGAINWTAPITGKQVRQAVAITAYMMAEAMQAESRKRQGGAV